jgi:hypothetical protein
MDGVKMTITLKGGYTASDPRLGRVPQFDEASRRYDVADVLPSKALVTKSWPCGIYLDQGQTAACVGNSRAYDLAASPAPMRQPTGGLIDETFAQNLYRLAQKCDEWQGENYEGSSVLGGLKAAVAMGYIGEYRWAFNIDDWLASISHIGGSVAGTVWLESMFSPRPSGLLEVDKSSGEAGGHAYYFRRILVSKSSQRDFLGRGETLRGEPLLVLRNSWGTGWSKKAEAAMWPSDYQDNLWNGGEQSVVTTARHR